MNDDGYAEQPDIPRGCVEIGHGDDEEIYWDCSVAGSLMERLQKALQKLVWELEVEDDLLNEVLETEEAKRLFSEHNEVRLTSLFESSLALVNAIPGIDYYHSFWEGQCISGIYKWYYVNEEEFKLHHDDVERLIHALEKAIEDFVDKEQVLEKGTAVFGYEFDGRSAAEEVLEFQGQYFRRRNAAALEGPFDTLEAALDGWAFRPVPPPAFSLTCEATKARELADRMHRQANLPPGTEVEINGKPWVTTEGAGLKPRD